MVVDCLVCVVYCYDFGMCIGIVVGDVEILVFIQYFVLGIYQYCVDGNFVEFVFGVVCQDQGVLYLVFVVVVDWNVQWWWWWQVFNYGVWFCVGRF